MTPRPRRHALSALAAGTLLTAVVAASLVCVDGARPRRGGPIPDDPASAGMEGTLFGQDGVEVGQFTLHNTSRSPAVVEWVHLLDGGGSDHPFIDPSFWIVGPERRFGGGIASAPSGRRFWGTEPRPAIGYAVLPDDADGMGALLSVRLYLHGLDDASFGGLEVGYRWRGDEYVYRSAFAVHLCQAVGHPPHDSPLCRDGLVLS